MPHSNGESAVERVEVGEWRWEDQERERFPEEKDGRTEGAAGTGSCRHRDNTGMGDSSQNHLRCPEKELNGKNQCLEITGNIRAF